MRKILIILDGVADRGLQTALNGAKTPNLDLLAQNSLCGMMYPIKGIAPESGAAQFTLLGQPTSKYPGRGPLEALGLGIKLKSNDIALRVNFAEFRGPKLINIRADIPNAYELILINRIHPDFKLIPSIGYRGVLVVSKASPNITNTHPGYKRYKNISTAVKPGDKKLECRGHRITANKLNSFIGELERVLGNRTILTRGAGKSPQKAKKLRNWSYMGGCLLCSGSLCSPLVLLYILCLVLV